MNERILVTGAMSPVGSELVRLLVAAGSEVKAGTRRPAAAREAFDDAVQVVELDYARAADFDAAVQWADRLFLLPPPFAPDAYGVVAPLLDWAVQAGTEHVVTVSAMGLEVRDDLPIRRLESHVESLGVDYTFLRPNFYMQTLTQGVLADRIRRTGRFSMPVDDARTSLVDGRDVAAVAAAALTGDAHFGAAYTLTGPAALTHAQVAQQISDAAGRPVSFDPCSDEEMFGWLVGSGWRREEASVVISLYQSVRAGVRARVTDDVEKVLGRPPTTFEDFVVEHADRWRS